MQVTLNQQFQQDLAAFSQLASQWGREMPGKVKAAHRRIGQMHRAEAVKRAPVDEGTLRQRILTNTYEAGGLIFTETGTNVEKYPAFVEFGTRYIAGGRVKRIGTAVDITDAQAVTLWPAKNFGSLVDFFSRDRKRKPGIIDEQTGNANRRVVAALEKRQARGGAQEQMPWLRPSFSKIRAEALELLAEATRPPLSGGQQGVA
jgi:hypothetical protein